MDMNVAVEFLKRQRNDALDQCAVLAAQATALSNEVVQLKARVEELEPKPQGELPLETKTGDALKAA